MLTATFVGGWLLGYLYGRFGGRRRGWGVTIYEPTGSTKHKIGEPDARNPNPRSDYFFITGYSGGGNAYGAHWTKAELAAKAAEKWGPGYLADDGVSLWWLCLAPVGG